MDWLDDASQNWRLKYAFLLYQGLSLILSLPLSFFLQLLLSSWQRTMILKEIRSGRSPFISHRLLHYLIDLLPFIIIIGASYFAFQLFYKHKIQVVVDYLDKPLEEVLTERNELSQKAFKLGQSLIRAEEDCLRQAQVQSELGHRLDTLLHEMKTPLAVLSGDLEILASLIDPSDLDQMSILARMLRNKERMLSYLDQLNLAREVKEIPLELEILSLAKLREKLSELLRIYDPQLRLESIDQLDDLQVEVDLKLLDEALLNILKNAKAHARSRVEIRLFTRGSEVIIEVRDDGPGFSQEALENYHLAYYSENPLQGNHGLGLYISEILLRRQKIELKVRNDRGAVVQMILPRK